MANALKTLFGDIASAIKEKTGETATMKPAEFPAKIAAIPTGGGGSAAGAVTVTFCNYDGTELYSRQVFIGDDCPDPVTQGKISTPTKESTAQYQYTHNGWSTTEGGAADTSALKNITADKTLYAAYSSAVRKYTVRFYDGNTLMKTESVAYGSQATPPSTIKDGFSFTGWTPSNLTIYGDTDFYGAWEVDAGWLVRKEFPNDMGDTATSYVRSVYSVDGSLLFVACGAKLYVYDATVQPYSLKNTYDIFDKAYCIAVSPDGHFLAVGSQAGQSYIYKTVCLYFLLGDIPVKLNINTSFSTGNSDSVYDVAFSSDSAKLYVSFSHNWYVVEIDTVYSDNVLSETRSCKKVALESTNNAYGTSLCCSPDGQKLAVGTNYTYTYKNIYIYNIVDGKMVFEDRANNINQNGIVTRCLKYSPDGKYLAVGGTSNTAFSDIYEIIVYDTTTTPYTRVLTKNISGNNGNANGVTFSHDGSMVAFAIGVSPYIEIYDVGTWTKRDAPMEIPNGIGYSIAFNNDDTMLAVSCYSTDHLYLYEVHK